MKHTGPRRRRDVLKALGATATVTALAGCESEDEDTGPLRDVRLVQVVEDTRVVDDGTEIGPDVPDPDLVAGQQTAAVFDLASSVVSKLSPKGLRMRVHHNSSEVGTFRIRKGLVRRIANKGATTPAVMHLLAHNRTPSDDPPVFRVDTNTLSVKVEVENAKTGSKLGQKTLMAGGDFEVTAVPPLRVGFVEVRDPDNGKNYGDGQGRCLKYDKTVEHAVEYLHRTYPGNLVAVRLDAVHVTGKRKSKKHATDKDVFAARNKVNKHGTSAPRRKGTVWTYGTSKSKAISDLKRQGFDVAVMIAPGNKIWNTRGKNYDKYHGIGAIGFYSGSHTKAVYSLEFGDKGHGLLAHDIVGTVAQEIGHYFKDVPYTDTPDHPLAQRDDKGNETTVNGIPVDRDHARHEDSKLLKSGKKDSPGVVSTGYDLTNGHFSLVNGFRFGPNEMKINGPSNKSGFLPTKSHPSFMSYHSGKTWADARIYQDLVDGEYNTAAEGKTERTALLAVQGTPQEGPIEVTDVWVYDGIPLSPEGEGVSVRLRDPAGEVVRTFSVSPRLELDHHVHRTIDSTSFVVAFPASIAEVDLRHRGVETRLNPITRAIRDSVARLPKGAIRGEPAELRAAVGELLDQADELMREGRYADAAALLERELRPGLAERLRDLEGPTDARADRLALLDRMVERLTGLADVA